MIHKTVDLYEYFCVTRGGRTGGFLTVSVQAQNKEIPQRIRPAVLVVPGGGYGMLSEREGEPVAIRFLSLGFAVFQLAYSVNTAFPAPLVEAALATAYIRENAQSFNVDKNLVAAIGFSAGGHLVGMLSTLYDCPEVKRVLGDRAGLVRPDAAIFSYPVVTLGERYTHEGSARIITGGISALREKLSIENCVTGGSVPAFIWHTAADGLVPVQNSLLLYSAYANSGVPCELHIFEKGDHGLSLANVETNGEDEFENIDQVRPWSELAVTWLQKRGFRVRVL